MTVDDAPTVTRNDEARRYEIHVGDALAGFTLFRADDDGRLVFPHTEIDPAFGGRGLGGILVDEALSDAARRGEVVVPVCPFVVKQLKKKDVPGLVVAWPDDADAQDAATPGEQSA